MKMELPEESKEKIPRTEEMKSTRRRRRSKWIPRIGCFRVEDNNNNQPITTDGNDNSVGGFSMEMERDSKGDRCHPTHLVVMVNRIIGSAADWKYAAEQLLIRYPHDVVVHCSERNSSMLTFDGVDTMGERLAEELLDCII